MSDPSLNRWEGDEWTEKELSSALSNTFIGVVALQGAFKEHCKVITSLGARAKEARVYVCLVIPGYENP